MQEAERALRQIAFGHVILPSGKKRRMYNCEMINLAPEICDRLGILYSNGACEPYRAVPGQAVPLDNSGRNGVTGHAAS
jgi:hypothetical protein